MQVQDSQFEKAVEFQGVERKIGNETGFSVGNSSARLRSWMDKATGTVVHQLYVANYYRGGWRFG
jgi:hypothetical protein